ncbi:hypothetical protein SAMN02745883_00730 [Caminicella sporogenes DSM 14501]|uniref:Uncharacterized protein n=1 Tax=Caminicella sporogenes DSM 14501 TaxID=1121266 RepID=A0A1M6MZX9_9FIRM|nr:hypothetical protein [Caminicella sporogenes]SHJ89011.1 hypothetical protein SAMN02745883_00730 [Caminicella sporogenes DSM 14501]
MIVAEYKLGNTTIRIHDDAYKDKTKEDIERIIKRIEEIGRRALSRDENYETDSNRS